MTRKAIVSMVGESWIAVLSLDETENDIDKSCGSGGCGSGSCSSGSCGCRSGGQPFRAAVPENLKLRIGDTVEVSVPTLKVLGAFLLILGLPILAAVSGWFAAAHFHPEATENIRAGAAFLGGAAGAALITLSGKMKKKKNLPEITSVLG